MNIVRKTILPQALVMILFSIIANCQSILLEPQTNGRSLSVKTSTGDYGHFSTSYAGNSYLSFHRNEPSNTTGNFGDIIGQIYTTNLNHFVIGTPLANTTGYFFLQTKNTPRMVIAPLGNIGIGTSNPLAKLHLYAGNSGVSFVSASNAIFESNSSHYINIAVPEAMESGVLFSKSSSGDASGGIIYSNTNSLLFRTAGNISRMAINNSGNVGIGTINPVARLNVSGISDNILKVDYNGTEQFGVRSKGLYLENNSDGSSVIFSPNAAVNSNMYWGFDNTGAEMAGSLNQSVNRGVATKVLFANSVFDQHNKPTNAADPIIDISDPLNSQFKVLAEGVYLVDMTINWDSWDDNVRNGRIEVRVNNVVRRTFSSRRFFREHCFIKCSSPDIITIWAFHEECIDPACVLGGSRNRSLNDVRVTVMKF